MRTLSIVLSLILSSFVFAVGPGDILPKSAAYAPEVPTPSKVLGVSIGERHLQHHEILTYFRKLGEVSPRVKLLEYAKSHGGRQLLYAVITSPENHRRLEEIRKDHVALCEGKPSPAVEADTSRPAVVVMGYGVHGNEPSASNVAPLVAYHLAAGTGKDHEKLLQDLIILLDPCLNPDGFERFANWANDNRGAIANPDPATREHREPWPTGRTNYYNFDLNRDWLPAVMPESRGRLAVYHQWKPNLVLDFHEMGSNSTYFFQPGDPKRAHPLIPVRNQDLTALLAKRHAEALDRIGSLYFTGEQFDDYYPGKGSTYPDLHGGVGILFEQASSRGHVQDTPNGRLTFPFTIRNQFVTSLSSLAGVQALRPAFLEFQRKAYLDALADGTKATVSGHLIAAPHDAARLHRFLELLHRHNIQAYRTTPTWGFGAGVKSGEVYWVPSAQPEYRFLQALLEQRTEFADSTFYDISAWTMPLAYGLKVRELRGEAPATEELYRPGPSPSVAVEFGDKDLAYAIDWRGQHAGETLHRLLSAGVRVHVAAKQFSIGFGSDKLPPGTLMVPLGIQPERRVIVVDLLKKAAGLGVVVHPIRTGQVVEGISLGSSSFVPVRSPRILLVVGEGVNPYEAGEVWHLLDRDLGMPLTRVETTRLDSTDLERYSAVVVVGGSYSSVSAGGVERLNAYAARGGTLIGLGTGITWLKNRGIVSVTQRSVATPTVTDGKYNQAEEDGNKQLIRGAIFAARVDATHPLGYGYNPETPLALFRSNRVILESGADPYNTPVRYKEADHLLAGYVSRENQASLASSAGAVVVGVGAGRAILIPDNPIFRGHWFGSRRLLVNALFFGPLIKAGGANSDGDDH